MAKVILNMYYPDYRTDAYLIPDLLELVISYITVEVNTKREQAIIVDNKRHGLYRKFDSNVLVKECTYICYKLEGSYRLWYRNGQLKRECTYINGNIHGLYREWHADGLMHLERTYVNGQLHGQYKEWYMNGSLMTECTYRNGKLHGIYEHLSHYGKRLNMVNYINGNMDGLYLGHDGDGKLRFERRYKNGVKHGLWKEYDRNVLKHECMYIDGKLYGPCNHYHNGELIYTQYFEDDKLVSKPHADNTKYKTDNKKR